MNLLVLFKNMQKPEEKKLDKLRFDLPSHKGRIRMIESRSQRTRISLKRCGNRNRGHWIGLVKKVLLSVIHKHKQ